MKKAALLTISLSALAFAALSAPALAWEEENRTVNRTPSGTVLYPAWLVDRPEHFEFLPDTSNVDPQNDHPAQWQGQDWDTTKWNSAQWTPETAVEKFFRGGIFARQYLRETRARGNWVPVLELGPNFYKLSDLDQRRSLKLLADTTEIFGQGYGFVELRDWHTRKEVGRYLPQGLYLN